MKTILTLASIIILSSCCCQRQGAPALRPMPKCESSQQVQPTLEIPVKVGK